jgi:hypothetical protein
VQLGKHTLLLAAFLRQKFGWPAVFEPQDASVVQPCAGEHQSPLQFPTPPSSATQSVSLAQGSPVAPCVAAQIDWPVPIGWQMVPGSVYAQSLLFVQPGKQM